MCWQDEDLSGDVYADAIPWLDTIKLLSLCLYAKVHDLRRPSLIAGIDGCRLMVDSVTVPQALLG